MRSILDNSEETLNIYVLHNEPETLIAKLSYIENHRKLNKIEILEFKKQDVDFPNLIDAHVSEATYFRLFIESFLPDEISNLVYVDPDVICVNNFNGFITDKITELSKSNYIVAAVTEHSITNEKENISSRLGMKNNKYFNAGVMIINFEKWKATNTSQNLIDKMESIYNNINFWDQDVMNAYFDGEYLELSQKWNFIIPIDIDLYKNKRRTIKDEDLLFMHYAGKFKPWNIRGLFHPAAEIYQKNFRLINKQKYHISNNWKKTALFHLLKSFFSLKFLKLKHPISFILISINYLIKGNDG